MQTRRIRRLHFHCTRGNARNLCTLPERPSGSGLSSLQHFNWTARALKASSFSAKPQKAQWYNIGQSLPHSLRLSAEKCKPNARSSWSSSPGQNGSRSHHQNNALALQIKHPFYSLLIVSHVYKQNACSFWFFRVCAWHTNLVVHVTDEAVAKCPAMMLSKLNMYIYIYK